MPPKSKKTAAAAAAKADESPSECGEKDVLMGRGKRISEWPGNIHFRQVVNKYRENYHSATRKEKVAIAKKVLDDISGIGGRFMHQNKGDTWEEVDLERAVEKACQALREKEKSRPPETSPFGVKSAVKPPKAPPSVRPASNPKRPGRGNSSAADPSPKTDRKPAASKTPKGVKAKQKKDENENENSTSTEDGNEKMTSADESVNGAEESGIVSVHDDDPGMTRYGQLPDERAFPLIEAFKEKHGHCAIPPYDCLKPSNDSEEMALANWCTAQRQLYREIQMKYRRETKAESQRIKKLEKLEFCWDYEAWHWEQSLLALQREMQQSSKDKMGLSDDALDWIQEQRRRGKRAQPPGTVLERTKKLKTVGLYLL